jgi:hypothetical protein
MSGLEKRTWVRPLFPCLEMTLRRESLPLFVDGSAWLYQLSAAGGANTGALSQVGGASTVQE